MEKGISDGAVVRTNEKSIPCCPFGMNIGLEVSTSGRGVRMNAPHALMSKRFSSEAWAIARRDLRLFSLQKMWGMDYYYR